MFMIHDEAGKQAPGSKLYATEKGAKMGFKSYISGLLQSEYLHNGKYHVYLSFWYNQKTNKNKHFIPGPKTTTNQDMAQILERKKELEEKYKIVECDVIPK